MKKLMETMNKNKWMKRSCILLAAFILIAGCWFGVDITKNEDMPELTSFVDNTTTAAVSVDEDEVPLGNTKVTTKKNTKTSKKTVKLKKASKKTYTVKKPTKTKTTTKTTKTSSKIVTVKTTTVTSISESYKKKAKKKTVTTKVVTTTKTTTTMTGNSTAGSASQTQNTVNKTGTTTFGNVTNVSTNSNNQQVSGPYLVDVNSIASKADASLLNAYKTLNFTVTINGGVSYAGYFDARSQQIILKQQDDTIYHELGHFLAFLAGNVDTKSAFVSVYNAEKNLYTGTNKAYVTQSSSEYFAESYKDYVLNPAALKSSRPQTYDSITAALSKLTDSYVNRIKVLYRSVWK